jgi:addiction module antidote protein, HigA family
MINRNDKLPNIHPGEILKYEFLEPLGLTQAALADAIQVQPIAISQIVHGKRSISVDMAMRLGRFFGVSTEFWLNLQRQYDIEEANDHLTDKLSFIKPIDYSAYTDHASD